MADIAQSIGEINITSRNGYAFSFTIDYPTTEGDLTGDTFAAKIYEGDGTITELSVVKAYSAFTRLTITLNASSAVFAGVSLWEMIRVSGGVPVVEFAGKWTLN